MRGATWGCFLLSGGIPISTHTPHAGRDEKLFALGFYSTISTHTPHAGRDPVVAAISAAPFHFNSHAPCGARQLLCARRSRAAEFQLTRPMRGATARAPAPRPSGKFQLTRPMRGATRHRDCGNQCDQRFQLTRPMRGATRLAERLKERGYDFNSHAPCGARRFLPPFPSRAVHFNSHAPCGARRC